MRRYNLSRFFLGLIIIMSFVLHSMGAIELPLVEPLEDRAYDMRLLATLPNKQEKRVIIVDIDEKSLDVEGRWPWGRDKLALLTDKLFDKYYVSVVGFDVLFIEEDTSSGLAVLNSLADSHLKNDENFLSVFETLKPMLEWDNIFAQSLQGRDSVLGYFFVPENSSEKEIKKGLLPKPVTSYVKLGVEKLPIPKAIGYGANLKNLQRSASHAGFIDKPVVDSDGVIRKVYLFQEFEGELYASLPLAMISTLMGNPEMEFTIAPGYENAPVNLGLEWLTIGGLKIPLGHESAISVPYIGPSGSFPYISATDVMRGEIDPELLDGAIILVGSSAAGLLDLRSTPVQGIYPGVEIHANVLTGILDESIMQKPGYIQGVEFISLIIVGIFMLVLLPLMAALLVGLFTLILLAGVIGINLYFWNELILVPIASTVLLIISIFIKHVSYSFLLEQNTKRKLHKSFGQYIPPELVDELSETQEEFSLEGESREMTVLFSDVRGFTSISENLEPKQLSHLMNAMLTPMTRVIHEHRGTIDKYMGDAVMAFWGAPILDKKNASHAIAAALMMIKELPAINKKFKQNNWPPINIGIGINTGMMSVGNMGSTFRMAYTVMGDAVNLGSRLEGLTKKYGVQIVTSEATVRVAPEFCYRSLDLVKVVGREEAIEIFEPLGLQDELADTRSQELALYTQALNHYRAQNWRLAEQGFSLLQQQSDQLLYKIYRDRIRQFVRVSPQADWDGVYTFTTK